MRMEAGGQVQYRTVDRAYSYLASNDPRVHYGLGKAERVDHVRVRWPDGQAEEFGPFDPGHVYDLREGTGKPTVFR